jgi:hypothetical protein
VLASLNTWSRREAVAKGVSSPGAESGKVPPECRDINHWREVLADLERTKNRQWIRGTSAIVVMLGITERQFAELVRGPTVAWTVFAVVAVVAMVLQWESLLTLRTHREWKERARPEFLDCRKRMWPPNLSRLYWPISALMPLAVLVAIIIGSLKGCRNWTPDPGGRKCGTCSGSGVVGHPSGGPLAR